jgi:hypothetical protein
MSGNQGSQDRNISRWVSIERAAAFLGMNASALRKALERRAVRASDGGVEATLDGVRARKLGRLWRVRFSEAWGGPLSARVVLQSGHRESDRNDQKGNDWS